MSDLDARVLIAIEYLEDRKKKLLEEAKYIDACIEALISAGKIVK